MLKKKKKNTYQILRPSTGKTVLLKRAAGDSHLEQECKGNVPRKG